MVYDFDKYLEEQRQLKLQQTQNQPKPLNWKKGGLVGLTAILLTTLTTCKTLDEKASQPEPQIVTNPSRSNNSTIVSKTELREVRLKEHQCSEGLNFHGEQGIYRYAVNLGTDTGTVRARFNPLMIPDSLKITYDGNTVVDVGFIGSYFLCPELRNKGYRAETICQTYEDAKIRYYNILQTQGEQAMRDNIDVDFEEERREDYTQELVFEKTTSTPTTALVEVTAPAKNTLWTLSVSCPEGGESTAPESTQ